VANLEIGDRIRVETDSRSTSSDEISARRIDVTASVQDSGTSTGNGGTVTSLAGRVTRLETSLDYAYVDSGRGEMRVDMRNAEDARGEIIRAGDLRVGDNIEISGSYNRAGDMFLASTVRFSNDSGDDRVPPRDERYVVVTMTGTITETLEDGPTLGFRDRDSKALVRIWVTEDFTVRTKGTTYTNAEGLRVNEPVMTLDRNSYLQFTIAPDAMPAPELLPGVTTESSPPRVVCDARAAMRKARRRAIFRDAMLIALVASIDYLFMHWPESRMPFLDRAASLTFLRWVNVLVVADLWLMRALPKWRARRVADTWCRAERERFNPKR
jgi:hypothetical protein